MVSRYAQLNLNQQGGTFIYGTKAEVHNIQKEIAEFGSTYKNETHQNIESMWQSFKTAIKSIID
jgi:hypothetical protein